MTKSKSTSKAPQNRRTNKLPSHGGDESWNLDELLNFSLPPRNPHGHGPRRARRGLPSQAVWNKEKFVNAQYRFVMKPKGDYLVHLADPDVFFQWQDIAEVIVPQPVHLTVKPLDDNVTGSSWHCPICLSPPVAPRMTKCGHIFCLSCFLRYLTISDHKWIRCPICFDSVTESQLKNVRRSRIHVDDVDGTHCDTDPNRTNLHMRLMARPQITNMALPHSTTWPSPALPPLRAPFHFLPDVELFAKFMVATPDYIRESLNDDLLGLAAERRELERLGDRTSINFIDQATDKVKKQLELEAEMDTLTLRKEIEQVANTLATIKQRHSGERASTDLDWIPAERDVPDNILVSDALSSPLSPRPSRGARRNVNPPPPSSSTYYFYQAANGLPVFLHPLDIRILLSKYSSYAHFPPEIVISVEASMESSVNDEVRKRCKYLAHLPEGADVIFVEADLTEVIGRQGLLPFEAALKSRRTKRADKLRKEERARVRAEEQEREKEQEAGFWRDVDYLGLAVQADTGPDIESFPASLPTTVEGSPPTSAPAWGARSFALAAEQGRPASLSVRDEARDESFDTEWHALEEDRIGRTTGNRRGKSKKLVILGGSGRRGRR